MYRLHRPSFVWKLICSRDITIDRLCREYFSIGLPLATCIEGNNERKQQQMSCSKHRIDFFRTSSFQPFSFTEYLSTCASGLSTYHLRMASARVLASKKTDADAVTSIPVAASTSAQGNEYVLIKSFKSEIGRGTIAVFTRMLRSQISAPSYAGTLKQQYKQVP